MDNKIIYIDNVDKTNKFSNAEEKDECEDVDKFGLKKIFTPKNIKILSLIVLAIVGAVILFGVGNKKQTMSPTSQSGYVYRSTLEYCAELEGKLEKVLSSIKGAGNVKVMISVDGSPEIVYATDTDEKTTTNSSGTTSESKSSSVVNSSDALILTENLPNVKGVIVVSSGAADVGVRLSILNAVATLLGISTEKVNVLKGN